MIVFDLKCSQNHQFEAWFRSGEDFAEQRDAHQIACPYCGDGAIERAISVPRVGSKSNQAKSQPVHTAGKGLGTIPAAMPDDVRKALEKVQKHIEETCDYVGRDFAEEARKIHYGEKEERGIYGEATEDETEELADEGIEVFSVPFPKKKGKGDA